MFPILRSAELLLKSSRTTSNPATCSCTNDPITGGTHLNDVGMIAPLFVDGELAFLPVAGRISRTWGGSTPGSISMTATDTFQEGVRIPLMRAFSCGAPNQDLVDVLLANMRIPQEREGDIDAMLGTCRIANRRLTEFAGQISLDAQRAA